ncbi:MAG: preprotein translocase subunit SecG [Porticoccaceae bacterium]
METLILVVHLLTAVAIVGMILLQQGKGADAGASFGSGASQTFFGSAGSWNFFSKVTAILATLFFITSFGLAIIAKDKAGMANGVLPELEILESSAAPAAASDIPVVDASDKAQGDDSVPKTSELPQVEDKSRVPVPSAPK